MVNLNLLVQVDAAAALFYHHELEELAERLGLPDVLRHPDNDLKVDRLEALMILISCLAHSAGLGLQSVLFGWDVLQIYRIVNLVIDDIYWNWARCLQEWIKDLMTPERCEVYADGAQWAGCLYSFICCLLDGTVRAIARPQQEQHQA